MYRVMSRKRPRKFEKLSTLIAISILAGLLAGGVVGLMSARSTSAATSTSSPKSFD